MALSESITRMFLPQRPDPSMLGNGMAGQAGMITELNRKLKEAYMSEDYETARKIEDIIKQMTQPQNGVEIPNLEGGGQI